MVNLKVPILFLIFAMAAACATRAAGPPLAPAASPKVLATRVVAWDKRQPAPLALPAPARRVQLIITPGWAQDEHYAWLVSNGADLIAVYRCTANQRSEILEAAGRLVMPTVGTPLDKVAFGVLGSVGRPPPPPPPGDPGGDGDIVERLPRAYVQSVLQTAWNLNGEQARIEGGLATP